MRTSAKLLGGLWFFFCMGSASACTLITEVSSAEALAEAIACFNVDGAGEGQYIISQTADLQPRSGFPPVVTLSASRLRIVGNGHVIDGSLLDDSEFSLFQAEGEDFSSDVFSESVTVFDGVDIQNSAVIAISVLDRHKVVLERSRVTGGSSFALSSFEAGMELRAGTEITNNESGVSMNFEDTLVVDNSRIENNTQNGIDFGGFLSRLFVRNGSSISFNGGAGVWSDESGSRQVVATNSTVSGNGADGMNAFGVDESLIANMLFADNGERGLYFSGEERLDLPQVSILGTTFSGNGGVGIEVDTGNPLLIQNATISGNGTHGVFYPDTEFFSPGNITIANSTIVDNLGFGVLAGSTIPLELHSSLMANNAAGNCGSNGQAVSSPSVVADDDSCAGIAEQPAAKLYGYLQDNGCDLAVPTASCIATHELLTGSAALGVGDCSGRPDTSPAVPALLIDQRGLSRPASCSAGAHEPQGTTQPGKLLSASAWHLLAFPLEPPADANTIEDVLGRDLPTDQLGNTWSMFTYEIGVSPEADGYVAVRRGDTVEAGKAYWLIQHSSGPMKIQMPPGSTPIVPTSQCTAGFTDCHVSSNLAGNPGSRTQLVRWDSVGLPTRTAVDFADTRYVATSANGADDAPCAGGCTPADAEGTVLEEGLVGDRLVAYDGDSGYEKITSTSGRLLAEWDAFWVPMLKGAQNLDVRWVVEADQGN